MLKISQLAKSYKNRRVVEDVSLSLAPGQVVGLLGPNGAGKTTCFYMIVGLVQADSGSIFLGEQDISRWSMDARARIGIGYLPQEASIFRRLTVKENLLSILELRKELTNEQRLTQLAELLEEFNIGHLIDSPGISLSGGERRRVEIARALAANPQYILLDEPFAGVDPISVADIKHIIEHLRNRGLGVLITDHHVRETLAVCEQAYIVSQGRVIASGTPAAVLDNEEVRRVYLGNEFKI